MQPRYSAKAYKKGEYVLPGLRWDRLVLENTAISVLTEKLFPRKNIIVAVLGSSTNTTSPPSKRIYVNSEGKEIGERIGKTIAERDCILINGAVNGLPFYPIITAHRNGSYTIGVSPQKNRISHTNKSNPLKGFDLILYAGNDFPDQPKAYLTFRDFILTLYPDIGISIRGMEGTLDECSHIIIQKGIYIPTKGSGGITDLLIQGITKNLVRDVEGIIIPNDSEKGLEDAINRGIDEAERRWKAEGRTQNRFSPVADELEDVMEILQK